jgi:hypothetical protein
MDKKWAFQFPQGTVMSNNLNALVGYLVHSWLEWEKHIEILKKVKDGLECERLFVSLSLFNDDASHQ